MTVVGKNFLFVHVPKSAGKTIARRLGGTTRSVPAHAPLFYFGPDIRRGRFTFSFVRNPWDRMVSAYTFICTKPPRPRDSAEERARAIDWGFRRWLLEGAFYIGEEGQQAKDARLLPFQRRSQLWWTKGCDFTGKVETIEQDFATVAQRIGYKPPLLDRLFSGRRLPHRNRSNRGDYRDFYDDETRRFIEVHFADDIKLFGYEFQGISQK